MLKPRHLYDPQRTLRNIASLLSMATHLDDEMNANLKRTLIDTVADLTLLVERHPVPEDVPQSVE